MDVAPRIELLGRRRVCRNAVFEVFLDEIVDQRARRVSDYLSVVPLRRDADGVTGVAVLPVRDGKFGLLRAFRHPLGVAEWEIPKGFIDESERPALAALRELEEETGYRSAESELLDLGCIAPVPSVIRARVRLFAALQPGYSGNSADADPGQGGLEFFEPPVAFEMAARGEIEEPCTLVAMYRLRDSA